MSTLKVGTIQDPTNSNTAISIDSAGQVSLGQKVGWLITGTDGTGTITTTPVPWATVNFDYQSGWNNTHKRYEIQKTGLYMIGYTMATDNDPDTWYLERSTNSGAGYATIQGRQQRKPSGGNTFTATHMIIYPLNSGDYIRVRTTGNGYYSWGPTNPDWMQFWGAMIG